MAAGGHALGCQSRWQRCSMVTSCDIQLGLDEKQAGGKVGDEVSG